MPPPFRPRRCACVSSDGSRRRSANGRSSGSAGATGKSSSTSRCARAASSRAQKLGEVFWPGSERHLVSQSLRSACSNIRKAIAQLTGFDQVESYFRTTNQEVSIDLDNVMIDVKSFVAHATDGDSQYERGDMQAALVHYRNAEGFYSGALLIGDANEPWVAEQAARVGAAPGSRCQKRLAENPGRDRTPARAPVARASRHWSLVPRGGRWVGAAILAASALALGLQTAVVARTGFLMGDFHAFYCAARVVAAWRQSVLHRAAANVRGRFRSTGSSSRSNPGVTIPAPLPGYAIAALVPLAVLPFGIAAAIWGTLLLLACAACVVTLGRFARTGWQVALAALSLTLCAISLPFGEVVPFALAGICGAAYFAWQARWRLPRSAPRER